MKEAILLDALKEIVDPITGIRNRMPEGATLNGAMAVAISNDPNHLKSIAEKALEQYASQPSAPTEAASGVRIAAMELYASKIWTYKAKNGKRLSIEDENGEKCWIVPANYMNALEVALFTPPTATPEAAKEQGETDWKALYELTETQRKEWADACIKAREVLQIRTTALPASTALPDGWISVEERLPEDVYGEDAMPESYLVYNPDNWAGIVYRVSIRENKIWFGGDKSDDVTHWQPLPTPPKK